MKHEHKHNSVNNQRSELVLGDPRKVPHTEYKSRVYQKQKEAAQKTEGFRNGNKYEIRFYNRDIVKLAQRSYAEEPLAFIQPDEILLCCCRVESDIELDL